MVRGYHVIFSTYGFWLPNDPRGSGSRYVGSEELRQFGEATYLPAKERGGRSVARTPHNTQLRKLAKKHLKYPPVEFSGIQARAVARGFADFVSRSGITIWACSILPTHVHLVIARHRYRIEQVTLLLKQAATCQLIAENLHPLAAFCEADDKPPHCWGKGQWKVFLNTDEEIRRAIRYAEYNPVKEGKPRQRWRFVTPFVGLQ
jgi:REP element-mobilizing transposase RayT